LVDDLISYSFCVPKADDAARLFFVLLLPKTDVFRDQILINPYHTSEQVNAHVAVGDLICSKLLNCPVVHVELVLLKERNCALVNHDLRQHRQLFPIEEILLRVVDAVPQLEFLSLDLVLVHED
jgi:hypothetical protein